MGGPWSLEVAPFEVRDRDGRAFSAPFLGGFVSPRPQLVDIDGDGDHDLFIQVETNELLFFEAEPAESEGDAVPRSEASTLRYVFRPDRFADLDIGEWYRFADVDGNGTPDLLAERPFSYLRMYRNVGAPGEPHFELVADTLRDTRGAPIFSDRQNIPNVADIDCNGRLDLLIGRLSGTITRYEAVAGIGSSVAPFQHVTDRFEGIEIVADPAGQDAPADPGVLPGPAGATPDPEREGRWRAVLDRRASLRRDPSSSHATLHGANTMALVDIDEDGDLDLFWGDFFEPGLLFIENRGSCELPDLAGEAVPFPVDDPLRTSGYNAPTFGDLDGDGDLDLLVGVVGGAYGPNTTLVDNLVHLEQGDDGGWQVRTRRFVSQLDVGSESIPRLVDLDGDGDLDLVVGSRIDPEDPDTSVLRWWENLGTPEDPAFAEATPLDVDGGYHMTPAFGDLDGDGDPDLILGTWRSELQYYENVGTAREPRFELADAAVVELTRGSNATPVLADLDGDGALDLIVGEASGALNHYRNVGGATDPRFELVSDELGGIDVGRRSVPIVFDGDDDGDLDLAVGSESDGILYYENRGGISNPDFVEGVSALPAPERLPSYAAPALGDLDGDGGHELLVGGAGGGLRYFSRPGDPGSLEP